MCLTWLTEAAVRAVLCVPPPLRVLDRGSSKFLGAHDEHSVECGTLPSLVLVCAMDRTVRVVSIDANASGVVAHESL